jgi:hypothetical protein
MVTVPSAIAVTRPPGVTVAMSGFDDVHVAEVVTTSVVPLLIVAVAEYWDDAPTAGGVPVTVTDDTALGAVLLPPHAVTRNPRLTTTSESEIVVIHRYGFRLIRTSLSILPSLHKHWRLAGSMRLRQGARGRMEAGR